MGALTFLNSSGDTTIAWTEDADEHWSALIERKLAEGVAFFVIDARLGTRRKVREAGDAFPARHIAIGDDDIMKLVGAGKGELVKTSAKPARNTRRSRDAKEIAKSESVAVRPARGG